MDSRTRFLFGMVIGLLVAGLVMVVVYLQYLHLPRIVGHAVAPDGTEMCIIQESGEPFCTSFIYRKPGRHWGWFYFDHEDWYWGHSLVTLDPAKGVAVFYRGKKPAVTFDWSTETYTLHRWDRTMTGAQSRLRDDYVPGQSVYPMPPDDPSLGSVTAPVPPPAR